MHGRIAAQFRAERFLELGKFFERDIVNEPVAMATARRRLGADVRIVHPEAQLSVMEIKWGLVPDMTGTQTLRHLVPQDVAKELTFTGRRLSGEEAVRLGLATRTADDPLAAAIELADEIATKSPDAIRAGKTLLSRAYTAEPAEGLRIEADIQKTLIGKPNQLEAVRANMEKRPPDFADPE